MCGVQQRRNISDFGCYGRISDFDDNFPNVGLRLEVCIGFEGLVKGEDFVNDGTRHFGVGF